MSSERIIRANDASYMLRAVVPDKVRGATAYSISIRDMRGQVVDGIDGAAVTPQASVPLAAPAIAGTRKLSIAPASPYAPRSGDVIMVGSDAAGWQTMAVRAYDATSGTIVTRDFVAYNFPVGAMVEPRDLSFEIDTTGEAWQGVGEATIVWASDTDALPWTEVWTVLHRTPGIGALEAQFRAAYPRYWEWIPDGAFGDYEQRAMTRLRNYFETRGRDIDRLVSSGALTELLLVQIALLVAGANADRAGDELKALKADLADMLALADQMRIWIDDNQDLARTESETQPAMQPGVNRGM